MEIPLADGAAVLVGLGIKAAVDFFVLTDSLDKELSLTGICCLISCLSKVLVSLVALIRCKLPKDSFFKLPPVSTLLAGVKMALLELVRLELFLMEAPE